MTPVTTDPQTLALLDRLDALRMKAEESLAQTALTLATAGQTLLSARALLAVPLVTAEGLDRTPPVSQ
jgi:hypothetical protein